MREVPSLVSVCAKTIARGILYGDYHLEEIFDLPSDLFNFLIMLLPPLALQMLHEETLFEHCSKNEFTTDRNKNQRKFRRYDDFNTAWKGLFKSRWPDGVRKMRPIECVKEQDVAVRCKSVICSSDWQHIYWETHLQNCLDEAAEAALIPAFDGRIGEITISDTIMKSIGYSRGWGHTSIDYSKLTYHCQKFGCYARCLRLQNVLCASEISELLRNVRLQSVVFRRIISQKHVDGACTILSQNSETLLSLEFIHSRLPLTTWNEIFFALYSNDIQIHGIRYFSMKSSSILESNPDSISTGLRSFFSSGRSLCSLSFCDSRLGPNYAKLIFNTLLDSSSDLSTLDLSDNNISGWLSKLDGSFSSFSPSSLGVDKSLRSLRSLNLRGNNLCKDDAKGLKSLLALMPNLHLLDISDNPIGDDGIRGLIPYFLEASGPSHLVELEVGNCNLSCIGVTQLLTSLSTLREPLKTLSIADNDLGSHLAAPLAEFLRTSHVKSLNIEDIGLGPPGFLKLAEAITYDVGLVSINISKNRGGFETANFISKFLLRAPELVVLNAGYNIMPLESLAVICAALKFSRGKLERLDLTGNYRFYEPTHVSMLSEFHYDGYPIIVFPSLPTSTAPYDDDP